MEDQLINNKQLKYDGDFGVIDVYDGLIENNAIQKRTLGNPVIHIWVIA